MGILLLFYTMNFDKLSSDELNGLYTSLLLDLEKSPVEYGNVTIEKKDEGVLSFKGEKITGQIDIIKLLATNRGLISNNIDQINKWIDFDINNIKGLNDHLLTETYLENNELSLADIIFYIRIHPIVSKWKGNIL